VKAEGGMGKVERRRSSRLKTESDWPTADGGLRSEAGFEGGRRNGEGGVRNAEGGMRKKPEAQGIKKLKANGLRPLEVRGWRQKR
jgi:hypothetical protein